jgi:DNA-binding PadR family transcriptional regulator
MRDWADISFSSIYYLLKKLEDKGLVASESTPSKGRGPARKVYSITEPGREAWYKDILKTINSPQRHANPFLLGLSCLPAIPIDETIQALNEYLQSLIISRNHVRGRWQEQSIESLPYYVDAMFDYSITIIEAEIEWIDQFIGQLSTKLTNQGE